MARCAPALLLFSLSAACHDAAGPDPATTPGRPDAVAGDWASVAVGEYATCALDRAGRAYCWGDNWRGRLGTGDTATHVTVPTRVVGLPVPLRAIAAGSHHQCALAADGRAYCWGAYDGGGELGGGTASPGVPTNPVAVAGGLAFRSISVGASHTCAVTDDDAAYCWGSNGRGELGAGAAGPCTHAADAPTNCFAAAPVPVAGGLRFRQVSAGVWHSCGVTDDARAFCWGNDVDGELGDAPGDSGKCGASPVAPCARDVPTPVAGGLRFMQVAAGAWHSCGLTTTGAAYCWGLATADHFIGAAALGNAAYLGYPSGPHGSRVPVAVEGGLTLREIAAGNGESCGLTAAGRAVCWGDNNFAQLGVGSTAPGASTRPRAVSMPAAGAAPQLAPDDVHACAVSTTGRIWCWGGYNFDGELGSPPLGVPLSLNDVRGKPTPVVVPPTE